MERELEARSEANIGWPFALFEGLCAGAEVPCSSHTFRHVATCSYGFLRNIPLILGGVAQPPSLQLEALGDAAYDQIQIGRGLAWLILS